MIKFLMAIGLAVPAIAGVGPSALYTVLNGLTFNPPGYTVVAYQSCMQNQNAGNNCGSFTRYEQSNGQYSYQLYGPAPCSGSCCREFRLSLACGATLAMSGVNENPTCVYSATLTLPQVCGVDMTVGNEAASVSPSALPPTATSTPTVTMTSTATQTATNTVSSTQTSTQTQTATGTETATPTATATATETATPTETATASTTSTPLFLITAFPSSTSTTTLTATSTPLFMMTAWPSPSPVNVSASSTPLFMYTAYPSISPNGTGADLAALVAGLIPPGSPMATILGSVAVGIVGVAALAYVVNHFRKGGSVSELVSNIKAQKGAITKAASMLPLTEEQKAKLNSAIDNPSSILPPEAQQAVAIAQNANAYKQQAIASLPISVAQKEALSTTVESFQLQVQERIQQEVTPIIQSISTEVQSSSANGIPITISAEDLADVQALLQAKQQAKQ